MADVVFLNVLDLLPSDVRIHAAANIMSSSFKSIAQYHITELTKNIKQLNPADMTDVTFKNTYIEFQSALNVWEGLLLLSEKAADIYKQQA